MGKYLVYILTLTFCVHLNSLAQDAKNVTLYGHIDPEPIHYAGCWGYVDSVGNEYALLGTYYGTSVIAISDSANIRQISFIQGSASNWREMVVAGDYGYIVSEGRDSLAGLQILDLSDLPDSARLASTYKATFSSAHILSRDVSNNSAFIYVSGTDSTGGVHILDVQNPENPVQVGLYAPYYIHDCHVRGDWMYAAAIYNGTLDIVDISDRSNPVMVSQLVYPGAFTHSSWTTEDGHYLVVTDEIDGARAHIWDISDPFNPEQVASYSGNEASLVHNPYIKGSFSFFSHNTEGLRVVDITDPLCPAEVGYYDTYPGLSGGFHGLWSAYPFLPSGLILGGNREDGLYIWRFNGQKGARIYGQVLDSITGLPVPNAIIRLDTTTAKANSSWDGSFAIGVMPSPIEGYWLNASAPGYVSKAYGKLYPQEDDSLFVTIELVDSLTSGTSRLAQLPSAMCLFPQPAGTWVNVNIHPQNVLQHVYLTSADGKRSGLSFGKAGAGEWRIDLYTGVKPLIPGMYIITMVSEDGVMHARCVIGD
ncbi:MAG: choice-of-anchor B family protein [Flavobacteriales bacterium]|nr:choice-of-anchor B family protein [Flavobacteriales bacterium]